MDRSRLLTPLAAEHVERLAALPEAARAVGEISAQHLAARARAVYSALGDPSGAALALAVRGLAHDCATLYEWAEGEASATPSLPVGRLHEWALGEAEAGDSGWSFGPVVAEAVAAGIAVVAGLTEPGLLADGGQVEHSLVMEVLEDLGQHLDALAPHLFSGLCRVDGEVLCQALAGCSQGTESAERLQRALQSICAWALAAVGRALGLARLSAEVLWEWASHDALWALVLAKGALSLQRPGPAVPGAAAALAAPSELEDLQAHVAAAVCGLAAPSVVFARELEGGRGGDEVAIWARQAELVRHRAHLATEVANTSMVGPLLQAARLAGPGLATRLAAFLAALLQPELLGGADPEWAKESFTAKYTLAMARSSAADLRSLLSCDADGLWQVMAHVPAHGALPRGFLRNCAGLGLAGPAPPAAALAALLQAGLASAPEPPALAALAVLAASTGAGPADAAGASLAEALSRLEPPAASAVAQHCQSWPGWARRPLLAAWLDFLESLAGGGGSISQAADAQAAPPPHQGAPLEPPPEEGAAAGGTSLRELLGDAPPELRCALDGRLVVDPVHSPHGHVFERSVLAQRLAATGGKCPLTGLPLQLGDCQREPALRRRAVQWLRERRAARPPRPRRLVAAASAAEEPGEGPNYDRLF